MSDFNKQSNRNQTNNSTERITSFGLKNFRVFKNYQNFQLKPFTILTGTNNSGKSSVTKALLLTKENEKEINEDSADSFLNYFNGEHNLGNHQLVKNNKNENTVFYFGFFENYQFEIDISPKGRMVNDYGIAINGETVISQYGGKINFNVLRLVEYFNQRVEYIELDNFHNVTYFINQLEESLHGFHSVYIDLEDAYEISDYGKNIDKTKLDELTIKYEKMQDEGVFATIYNLDCEELNIDYDYLDEETLDLNWDISLIYLFYKITEVELTKEEINKLIPFPEGVSRENDKKMLSFNDIIYIPTIKEQIKRSYSLIDTSIINKLIRREIRGNINWNDNKLKYEIKISKSKKDDEPSWLSWIIKIDKFAQKWLKEFEIGEKLSYGYNIETDTFYIKIDDKYLPEYGFGYSQVLYIIFALHNESDRKEENSTYTFPRTYIIEEPETGLHPSFQSKIAEMIIDAHKKFHMNFIIETHSEYFIRMFQYLTANQTIDTEDTVIYYFKNPKKLAGEDEQVKEILIDKYGGLSDDFGKGFIDEATTLKFNLLRLNKSHQN